MEIEIPRKQFEEINEYCLANNIKDVNKFILKLIKKGFDIEKWGDINLTPIPEVKESAMEGKDLATSKKTSSQNKMLKQDKEPSKPKKKSQPEISENQIDNDIYNED